MNSIIRSHEEQEMTQFKLSPMIKTRTRNQMHRGFTFRVGLCWDREREVAITAQKACRSICICSIMGCRLSKSAYAAVFHANGVDDSIHAMLEREKRRAKSRGTLRGLSASRLLALRFCLFIEFKRTGHAFVESIDAVGNVAYSSQVFHVPGRSGRSE